MTHCCTTWQREAIFWLVLIWAQTQMSAKIAAVIIIYLLLLVMSRYETFVKMTLLLPSAL